MPRGTNVPIDTEVINQIALLIEQGMTYRAIARELGICDATVRKYKNAKPVARDEFVFTKRQFELAMIALENRETGKVGIR